MVLTVSSGRRFGELPQNARFSPIYFHSSVQGGGGT